MVLFQTNLKMLTHVKSLPYRRAGLLSRQRLLVVDNRFGNRWIQDNSKEGEEVATTVTTKDRQQLVHNLSMDNIHHLKNIIYHQENFKKEYEFETIFSYFVLENFENYRNLPSFSSQSHEVRTYLNGSPKTIFCCGCGSSGMHWRLSPSYLPLSAIVIPTFSMSSNSV